MQDHRDSSTKDTPLHRTKTQSCWTFDRRKIQLKIFALLNLVQQIDNSFLFQDKNKFRIVQQSFPD